MSYFTLVPWHSAPSRISSEPHVQWHHVGSCVFTTVWPGGSIYSTGISTACKRGLDWLLFGWLCRLAAASESHQSCPALCDPIDSSPPGSPVPGILQARTMEWVAISFSNAWKWKMKVKLLSRVRLLATPWTAAYQAPLSMGFSRQEY